MRMKVGGRPKHNEVYAFYMKMHTKDCVFLTTVAVNV